MNSQLNIALAQARQDDLRRAAAAPRVEQDGVSGTPRRSRRGRLLAVLRSGRRSLARALVTPDTRRQQA